MDINFITEIQSGKLSWPYFPFLLLSLVYPYGAISNLAIVISRLPIILAYNGAYTKVFTHVCNLKTLLNNCKPMKILLNTFTHFGNQGC